MTTSNKERILATPANWETWRQERHAENRANAQAALALLALESGAPVAPKEIDTVVTSLSDPQLTILLCRTSKSNTFLQINFWTDSGILSTARITHGFPLTSHVLTPEPEKKYVILPDENQTQLDVSPPDRSTITRQIGNRHYAIYNPHYTPHDVKTYRTCDPDRFSELTDPEVAEDIKNGFLNAENEAIISFVNLNYPPSHSA